MKNKHFYKQGDKIVLTKIEPIREVEDEVDYVTPTGKVRLKENSYTLYNVDEEGTGRPVWRGSISLYFLPLRP